LILKDGSNSVKLLARIGLLKPAAFHAAGLHNQAPLKCALFSTVESTFSIEFSNFALANCRLPLA
jgi:hypothetical protein